MAYLDVYYGRIGSYNGSIKIDDSTLDNSTQFSSTGMGAYTAHNFIKPVGLFQNRGGNKYNVMVFAIVENSPANCIQYYQNYSGHSISYTRIVGGFYEATILPQYIPNINYFNVIPWFNNIDDASNWSCGNTFNPANWVGGLDVRVQYNWQSVPSISGKNGILSLAQIKEEYINDGESVSGASADHFTNLSTENRVDVLIDDALPAPEIGGTTVTVEYTIPSLSIGSYEYCKLVAKKNSIPEGPEDGDKIIDINPSLTSIVVRGLDELSTYYFVIFIEDDQDNTASSEPKSCKTGEDVLAILKLETYGTTIYGQFSIPFGNVQNKTVVAKANGVPENTTDGIAFSLSSYAGNPFRMTGFSANTHYYFVIFDETPNASRLKSNVMDITTPELVNVLMDSDSRYIDNTMLDYSIVNQSQLSQNWYHYDSSNVYYYKNNYYNSGHSYLIFDNVINTGSYKYICVDAEIFDGSVPSAADQHWNYLAGAIVLASDGTPVCQTSYDSVTNAHKTIYMARWDEFIPANNKDWLTTGKLPRYMIKIPINDIPNTDIRLIIFSCDAKNRVYGVLLEG